MCQLFAVTGREPLQINDELKSFAENSHIHKHGWGYADFTGNRTFIKKELEAAFESKYLKIILATPLKVQNAFFHIRYATIGDIVPENVHPFSTIDYSGRQWTLIHNGTLFNPDKIDDHFPGQKGTTDSERLLFHLVSRMNNKIRSSRVPLREKERFAIVDRTITQVSCGNKLNVIIHDGSVFYIHGNSRSGSRLLGDIAKNDYLYEFDDGESKLFATVPLDDREWKPIQVCTVLAYKDGEKLFEGQQHEFEYIESEDDIKYLYGDFSGL
ncbi:MAG: class II glutamine amidotransferase [Clostridiales Family XIII bacterium]|jgi:glutamine amidotransferase|nr:class II glutamine amidotransferase [Clostridiales Family XIII bacterium]